MIVFHRTLASALALRVEASGGLLAEEITHRVTPLSDETNEPGADPWAQKNGLAQMAYDGLGQTQNAQLKNPPVEAAEVEAVSFQNVAVQDETAKIDLGRMDPFVTELRTRQMCC